VTQRASITKLSRRYCILQFGNTGRLKELFRRLGNQPLLFPQISKPYYAASKGREPSNGHADADSRLSRNWEATSGALASR
jgi:hypothetical protein